VGAVDSQITIEPIVSSAQLVNSQWSLEHVNNVNRINIPLLLERVHAVFVHQELKQRIIEQHVFIVNLDSIHPRDHVKNALKG